MAKKRINVYTNMDNNIERIQVDAIILNKVIKYIDSVNNKFVVDCTRNILIKENDEYIIKIFFDRNIISILMKGYNKEFIKEIETLLINNTNNIYCIKYKLIDENIVNEYQIEFL